MRKVGHVLAIVLVLFCVGITESFAYTLHEAAATERCDDLRESEEFRISHNNIKVSKAAFVVAGKDFRPQANKITVSNFAPAPPSFQFLYLRLRVLRN